MRMPTFASFFLAALCNFFRQVQGRRLATNLTTSRRLPPANLLFNLLAILSSMAKSEYVPNISSALIMQQITTSIVRYPWNQLSPLATESWRKTLRTNCYR